MKEEANLWRRPCCVALFSVLSYGDLLLVHVDIILVSCSLCTWNQIQF